MLKQIKKFKDYYEYLDIEKGCKDFEEKLLEKLRGKFFETRIAILCVIKESEDLNDDIEDLNGGKFIKVWINLFKKEDKLKKSWKKLRDCLWQAKKNIIVYKILENKENREKYDDLFNKKDNIFYLKKWINEDFKLSRKNIVLDHIEIYEKVLAREEERTDLKDLESLKTTSLFSLKIYDLFDWFFNLEKNHPSLLENIKNTSLLLGGLDRTCLYFREITRKEREKEEEEEEEKDIIEGFERDFSIEESIEENWVSDGNNSPPNWVVFFLIFLTLFVWTVAIRSYTSFRRKTLETIKRKLYSKKKFFWL